MEPIFTGVATAIVTPFSDGALDLAAYDRILEQQLAAGIHAIVVCGTTGEASTLDTDEKRTLWKHTAARLRGKCKLIAGVGTNNTRSSVRLAALAADCGADALLAVTPYYNKCTQDGLLRHYTRIAETASLPLILYNVPSRTGVNLLPETVAKLSSHPYIAGVKEASGNLSQVAKLRALCGTSFPFWSGNDDQIVPIMALGGSGVISVLSNVAPRAVVKMTQLCMNGNYPEAAKLQARCLPLIDALFSEVNPIPVKAALAELGLCKNELRLPLTQISAAHLEQLCKALCDTET